MWKWRLYLYGPKVQTRVLEYESFGDVIASMASYRFVQDARKAGFTEWEYKNEQIPNALG